MDTFYSVSRPFLVHVYLKKCPQYCYECLVGKNTAMIEYACRNFVIVARRHYLRKIIRYRPRAICLNLLVATRLSRLFRRRNQTNESRHLRSF
jgi:hypothetical protein